MSPIDKKIRDLFRRWGTVRTRDLVAAGMSRTELSRRVAVGDLVRVARGVYSLPDYAPTEHGVLAVVTKRVPGVLFCLLTALRFHELTTQSPFEVWIAIGNKSWVPELDYPQLRVVRFSPESLSQGVDVHRVEGTEIRVTSVAKTVADCFKFRNKVGLDVALEALREARRSGRASADDLWRYAELNRVSTVMRPYLEAVE
jgi:predicted transcriptional regulator of viral defense system